MVYYYRPRRRYQQRRRFRRRRYFPNYRRYRQRRYRRRQTVRRRRKPRYRRFRKKSEKVVTWRPPRVNRCKIHGWDIGIGSYAPFFSQNGEQYWKEIPGGQRIYRWNGGGVSVRNLSLKYFFTQNQLHMNTWSKSNEGFDLARYFGTKVTLYRHPYISYIFWYNAEFGDLKKEHYENMHPARLLLTRRRRLVLSKELGGKKRHKVFIRPPSTLESKWYSMSSWCTVNVATIGFTPVNFKTPFWHTGQITQGVWIGYMGPHTATIDNPPKLQVGSWNSFTKKCMYRWQWDTGVGNAVLANDNHWIWGSPNPLTIKHIDIPYYQWFYGHTAVGVQKPDAPSGGASFANWYPDILAILWYADEAIDQDGRAVANMFITDPSQTNLQNNRVWILLHPKPGTDFPTAGTTGYDIYNKLPTVQSVNRILNAVCTQSPFAVHGFDQNQTNYGTVLNVPFFYSSYWQWGGAAYSPSDPTNPCPNAPANTDYTGVRISDPATVALTNLHPWDLDQQGIVTRPSLLRLLREIFTTGTPSQYSQERIQSGRGEREEQEPDKSSGDSSSSGSTCSSESTTETEETDPEETPQQATQALQRKVKKLHRRMELDRRFKQQLIDKLKSLEKL
nr:ORF1 [Torque teno arctocephalus australis virus 2]